ncbi:hypothetical protein [Salimicrobium halophilum]|uniref:Uncharacterized protein n=1 Tax=Salimicrobium halophilum TaxID=86666 RepID=A0A1G8REJ3_9BACI|nr:hypothetical protein [Salimicrobium halophilum]SDJ15412.1 hypothetical protein SAMN04490247_0986 [Salimicrobium halophilum]
MNQRVLHDKPSVLGFLGSFLLGGIAIALAAVDHSMWLVFLVLSQVILIPVIGRTSRLTHETPVEGAGE